MALPSQPTNFYLQQSNFQVYLLWDITLSATSYQIQRSLDGVNFTNYATATTNSYVDTAVTIGTLYYYQVAAVNITGTSPYTNPQSTVPTPNGEMSLMQIRTLSQQKADRVNSNFVTLPEWNSFINLAYFELYDLLITVYEDYFMAKPASFRTNGNTQLYPLPDGLTTFQYVQNGTTTNFIAAPFYKMAGLDLSLGSQPNGYVTVDKFNFYDRNKFIYPNTNSTLYGVFNVRYRIIGNQIELIPAPSANQLFQMWYVPRLQSLLQETDITTLGFSGWLEYVICRAAKYALDKEESDTTKLENELIFIKQRIEQSATNRDQGRPDTITDVRSGVSWGNSDNGGYNGAQGGF